MSRVPKVPGSSPLLRPEGSQEGVGPASQGDMGCSSSVQCTEAPERIQAWERCAGGMVTNDSKEQPYGT